MALLFGNAAARAASFTASLDRETISLGETATLSLSFEGGQPKNIPSPQVSGLQIQGGDQSSQISIINGRANSTFTYTFSLTPQQSGEFTIPAMTADVNGEIVTSRPLTLTVTKASVPSAAEINSGNEVAFMKLTLPRGKIYAGETLVAQLEIYLRDDVQNFGNFRFTSTPADGFAVGKMKEGQKFRRQVGNRVFTVIPISIALTATKSGTVSLGPFAAGADIVLPSPNGGGDPFFNQFFNMGQRKSVTFATEEISVQSLSLPDENVPANFNGAVGDYTMTVTAGPTNVAVGDPITVRVKISGRGALDEISLPQNNWKNFKVFSPTSKTETSDQLGLQGEKTFEEIVTPQNSDIRELPEFSFSFFNPGDGKYHTLTQSPTTLVVRSAGATPLPTIAATKNSAQQNQPSQNILPIKNDLGALAQISTPLVTNPIFLGAQSLPVLAFLATFVWRKRKENLANNPRLRRKIAVAHLVEMGIADLKKFAAENNSEQFFATLFRLLQEQLGERLNCPAASITENVVEENPVLRSATENLRNDLRELFQLCNQARYAPVRGTAELNSVAEKFENAVQELQEVSA